MLRHLGGVGVFILAALDSSVLPSSRHAHDSLGRPAPRAMVLLRHVQGRLGLRRFNRLPPVAFWSPPPMYRGSGIRQSHDILTSFWKPFSVARRNPSATISDFRFCNWCWPNTLSLCCVCVVFRHGTGVPLCPTGYLASAFGRRFVTSMWSAHTLALLAAIGGALMCIGLLVQPQDRSSCGVGTTAVEMRAIAIRDSPMPSHMVCAANRSPDSSATDGAVARTSRAPR